MDTNKWKQIEAKIVSAAKSLGSDVEGRHLRGQLDERETSELIARLKKHNCLFRLEHKSDENIKFLFRKKAKRGLLTCLIEATRGTEELQNLGDILWHEYSELPERARWAYAFVMLFTAFRIEVPNAVFERALALLTGDKGYFLSHAFTAETAEIIWERRARSYSLRHPLLAETMLDRFKEQGSDGFKSRIIQVWLCSLDLSDARERYFFELALERKILRVVTNLEPLIDDLWAGKFAQFNPRDHARILNSIIRIYQGRRKYEQAKRLSEKSLSYWGHIGNQAHYLKGFCLYHLGEAEEAKKVALDLVKETGYPYHVLHGVALLGALQDWQAVDKALKEFEKTFGSEALLYPEFSQLRTEADWRLTVTSVGWSDSDIETLKPALALDRIEWGVDAGADKKLAETQFSRLLRRQHNFFKGYLSFFSYLHKPRGDEEEKELLERFQMLKEECEYHLGQHEGYYKKYPNDILSLLHSNLARALFKLDYISQNGYQNRGTCETNFGKAIGLKSDNWYAHNWYATFLKEAKKDFEGACRHYTRAVNGDKTNPVFRHNLALLYYRWPTFSRKLLIDAKEMVRESQATCQKNSQWESFILYPQELLARISIILDRNDLKEGEELDTDELLPADAE